MTAIGAHPPQDTGSKGTLNLDEHTPEEDHHLQDIGGMRRQDIDLDAHHIGKNPV